LAAGQFSSQQAALLAKLQDVVFGQWVVTDAACLGKQQLETMLLLCCVHRISL
jgi:hypothetical protein